MVQVDLSYAPTSNVCPIPIAATIFSDSDVSREEWCEDAEGAGLLVVHGGDFSEIAGGSVRPLGDAVLADCPDASAEVLAAMARLDERVGRSGSALVVAVSQASLEPIFACLQSCNPHILVDPSRGERVVALGRVMADKPRARLRELSEEDRLALHRLTHQVSEIAERLERIGKPGLSQDGGAFKFESPTSEYRGEDGSARLTHQLKPALPDPRLVRQIIQQRQLRSKFIQGDLFADPAWDILLDLTAARAEHERVSVTSLCIASGVPPTTALRWITQLIEAGLLERVQDDTDKRRAFIALTDKASHAMAEYFAAIGAGAVKGG